MLIPEKRMQHPATRDHDPTMEGLVKIIAKAYDKDDALQEGILILCKNAEGRQRMVPRRDRQNLSRRNRGHLLRYAETGSRQLRDELKGAKNGSVRRGLLPQDLVHTPGQKRGHGNEQSPVSAKSGVATLERKAPTRRVRGSDTSHWDHLRSQRATLKRLATTSEPTRH